MTFRDNTTQQRLEWSENGYIAYASYRLADSRLTIPHVEAAVPLRGTGAAGRLMEAVIAHAREQNLKIVPLCSYAVAWFKRHPGAGDVLA